MNYAARHLVHSGSPLPYLLPNYKDTNKLAILSKHNKNPPLYNYDLSQIEETNSENSRASPYSNNPGPNSIHEDPVRRRLDFSSLTPLKESAANIKRSSFVNAISPYRVCKGHALKRQLVNGKPTHNSIRGNKSLERLKQARSINLRKNELKLKELFHVYNIPYQRSLLLYSSKECQNAIVNANYPKLNLRSKNKPLLKSRLELNKVNRSKSLPSKNRIKPLLVLFNSKQKEQVKLSVLYRGKSKERKINKK